MIIHHFYSIYFKGNNLFLHNNNYLHEVLLISVYFTNALNGPVVIDGFSKHCGQESHVNGMNQSHNGTEGCVHCDVYTVNSQLTYGVRDEDTQVVLHQSMKRREGTRAIVAWNTEAYAE